MPSIGHVAVGLAAGRFHAGPGAGPRQRLAATAVLTALAILPDLDVLAPRGASAIWLHRGASHSLLLAACAALVATALAGGVGGLPPRFGARSRWRMAATALAVAASHGILDAFTHGARGPMLLWPFSTARILAPVGVVPASPFLPRLLTPRGLHVLATELVLFLPLLAYGLWPARRALQPAPERATKAE